MTAPSGSTTESQCPFCTRRPRPRKSRRVLLENSPPESALLTEFVGRVRLLSCEIFYCGAPAVSQKSRDFCSSFARSSTWAMPVKSVDCAHAFKQRRSQRMR
jgi:hypothetical protein